MKAFQKFILLTFLSFTIKGVWTLSLGKPFFERFTLDFYGFLSVMQFFFVAFSYVYVYEKTPFYKNIDFKKPQKFISIFISCLILSFVVSLILGTIKMHLKIELNNYLQIFIADIFYNFLFLSMVLYFHKFMGLVPIFRLDYNPAFYLKLFAFKILYTVGLLLFTFTLATSDSDKKIEVTTIKFLIDGILFAIILVNLAFFISYGINKIAFFRKSIFFPLLITTTLTFWIIKLIGYPQDYFRVFITENTLELITLFICNSIVVSPIKESKRNFKINKLTSNLSKKEAEYLQLKNQINPHFLFNNLNVLVSFIELDPKKAIEFGHHLSNVYRHYLKNQTEDYVSLQEEINFITEYLEIYKAKFEKGFVFKMPEQIAKNQYILPNCLQELIDNIFKHNVISDETPLEIEIFIEVNSLVIQNTVNKKEVEIVSNFGLKNIKKRYMLLTNTDIQIMETPTHFSVKIPILELESK